MEDKKEKAIVKHSNQLAEVPFQNFTAKEIDFFYAICYNVQNQGTERVEIGFHEFRDLIGYTRRGDEALIKELKEMSIKFSRITLMEQKKKGFKIIVPFIDFEADLEKKKFAVGVHPEFASALNELDGTPGKRYTLADVIAISRMKSTYSKQCLRMLFLYRNTGYWYPTLEELRYYLDIPDKYRTSDINKRVLEVIKKEFTEAGLFEEFNIYTRNDDSSLTSGRKKILGYTFSFKFVDGVVTKENKKTEQVICPVCQKPLMQIKRKDGGVFWGHKDGWKENAACKYTVSSKDEIKIVGKGDVSIGDLERYYRKIREDEIIDLSRRKELIKHDEPEIWKIYEKREKVRADSINQITAFAFSDESREEKQKLLQEVRDLTDQIKNMLVKNSYSEDFMEIRYKCRICKDTGQRDDGTYCECRRERIEELKKDA